MYVCIECIECIVCMYVCIECIECIVCMYVCLYVCMHEMYVCMYVMYVCMYESVQVGTAFVYVNNTLFVCKHTNALHVCT